MSTPAEKIVRPLTLEQLRFSNSFARLPEHFHTRVLPTPLASPYLISFNPRAAELIDLDPAEADRADFPVIFNGGKLLPGSEPLAMLYAGHQFGHYVSQLGDGRAIILGEVMNARGERWELQLKGAGQTPYSRAGDGRAVLRSTIREYLCSEAMHGLGIPTTRALCIVGSNEEVYRESIETGAMLLRMAPSHVRFGSFEVFYYRNQHVELRTLADYVIEHHYPEFIGRADRYLALYREVVVRTARLLADWQLVGFAHGVMNTDNMSILGLTLDYGPFGFLDDYEPGFICNHSDHHGRYAFDRQPEIALWNLSCLGQSLLPLFDDDAEAAAEQAMAQFDVYQETFREHYGKGLRRKLGLRDAQPGDLDLAQRLLDRMAAERRDHTNTWRLLGEFRCAPGADNSRVRDHFIDRAAFDAWSADYAARLRGEHSDDAVRRVAMHRSNPKYVLRNYLAQTAIDSARDRRDYSLIDRLLRVLADPYAEHPRDAELADPPPDWGRKLSVSCSS
ncbi:MAG TPA: YdiU family protein [Gammaproteobacteria bacterium]